MTALNVIFITMLISIVNWIEAMFAFFSALVLYLNDIYIIECFLYASSLLQYISFLLGTIDMKNDWPV